MGKILAVKKYQRIRRCPAGLLLRAARAGSDDFRQRPVAIVNVPLAARQYRRVGEADLGLNLPDHQRTDRYNRYRRYRPDARAPCVMMIAPSRTKYAGTKYVVVTRVFSYTLN